jgi:hypothetical protein
MSLIHNLYFFIDCLFHQIAPSLKETSEEKGRVRVFRFVWTKVSAAPLLMSAKKKRRKIVVNSALAKVGECGPNCKKTQMANKLLAEDDKREVSTLSFVKTMLD